MAERLSTGEQTGQRSLTQHGFARKVNDSLLKPSTLFIQTKREDDAGTQQADLRTKHTPPAPTQHALHPDQARRSYWHQASAADQQQISPAHTKRGGGAERAQSLGGQGQQNAGCSLHAPPTLPPRLTPSVGGLRGHSHWEDKDSRMPAAACMLERFLWGVWGLSLGGAAQSACEFCPCRAGFC